MRIALDAMGGDFAPEEVVKGGLIAVQELGVEVALVGQEAAVRRELAKLGTVPPALSVVAASDIIAMDEHPAIAVRQKRDSSLVVGMNLVKSGQAAALVSAGNSGAVMAAALFALGRLEGIERPALGAVFPSPSGPFLLLDIGANVDCKATHLVQFAQMGSAYMERVMGMASPRVALLSNGVEETKGSQVVQETHELLRVTDLNFVGNIEGHQLPTGAAEVVVADGFTGNVALKLAEGMAELILGVVREEIMRKTHFRLAAAVLRSAFSEVRRRLDYAEYGGAPLLGLNGVVVVAHGRSKAQAIRNAVGAAKAAVDGDLVGVLRGVV